MTEEQNITLDDVEVMLAILERFIHLSKRAERIVRHLSPRKSGGQGDMISMMMNSLIQQKMTSAPAIGDQTGDDISDEDVKELIAKIKAKKTV